MKGAWKYKGPGLSILPRYAKGTGVKTLQLIAERVAKKAAELEDDTNLSDAGRRNEFTSSIFTAVFDLATRETELKQGRNAVQRDRKKRLQDQEPAAANTAEMMMMLQMVQMSRESEDNRAFFWKYLQAPDAAGMHLRMQCAFLTVPAEMFGLVGSMQASKVQETMRDRLGINDLGNVGDELDEQETQIEAELRDLRQLRVAMIQSADRDRLVAAGLAMKPFGEWTNEEKRNYLHEHGQTAFAHLIQDEREFELGVRAEAKRDFIMEEMGDNESAEEFTSRMLETPAMRAERLTREDTQKLSSTKLSVGEPISFQPDQAVVASGRSRINGRT